MKFTKYVAIALAFVAVLLATGWFLRNTIIERISGPLLAQYGLTVTDVSLDALATRDATISYLELEHLNGTTIAIDNLTLPIATSSSGFKAYAAEKISLAWPATPDDEPPDIAGMLTQLLALPLQLPQTEINVSTISAPPYPELRHLRWQLADTGQQLTALVAESLLTTKISRTDELNHVLEFSFADAAGVTPDQAVTVNIQQTGDGMILDGAATLNLALWMPIATMLGIDTVQVESGMASLQFDAELLYDRNLESALYADFAPTSPVHLAFAGAPDAITAVTLASANPFEITVSIPGLQWSFRQAEASLLVSHDQWQNIHVSLINQSCQSGPACSGDIGIVMENAVLPFANVDRLEVAATQDLSMPADGLEMRILANAALTMTGISNPEFTLDRFDARLNSTAALDLGAGGWQASAESIDIGIEAFSLHDEITISVPVFLDQVSISEFDRQLSATLGVYASSHQVDWGGRLLRLPGFSGGISLQGAEFAVVLDSSGLYEEAGIEVSHNLDQNSGRMSLRNAVVSFGSQALSSRVAPLPADLDISAGTAAIDLQAEWQQPGPEWQLTGQSTFEMTGLAGTYNDTAFVGLSTRIDAGFDSMDGLALEPSSIAIELIEVGVPIENLSADYLLHAGGPAVDVQNLRMHGFGGVITADPFSFITVSYSNNLLLHAESIDLAEILSMVDFESIEISGSIGAELPVTIEGDSVTILGGSLLGEPPGGVIRYLRGAAGEASDQSAVGLATRALSNFEFESLTSEVDYTTDGDLNLQMHLTGRNPDLDDSRPVVLNLGVENNIPQMLRSLRAARTVEEILENRLAQ